MAPFSADVLASNSSVVDIGDEKVFYNPTGANVNRALVLSASAER